MSVTDQPPVDTPAAPTRPGILHEGGEPFRAPWEAQEIEIPPRRPSVADPTEPDTSGLADALARFTKHVVVEPGDVTEDAAAIQAAAEKRDHLANLQRWAPRTENIVQIIASVEKVVAEYAEKKKKPPSATLRRLRECQVTLALCLERDAIVAERAEAYPGCLCIGLGGWSEVAVCLREPCDPTQPFTGGAVNGRVIYIEKNPVMTWSRFCDHCPEGEQARERDRVEREALRRRYEALKAERLLGAAQLPEKYAHRQLEQFPDARLAARIGKWYVRNIEGSPEGERAPRVFLLLHGPNRRGKTTLAASVANLALERGEPATWRSMKRILDEIKSTYDKESKACSNDVLQALYTAPFLVIDDLGAEHLTGWVEETIYGIFEERLNHGLLTIITSNLGWADKAVPGDTLRVTEANPGDWNPEEMMERVGERTWWRIRDGANQVPVIGPVLGIDDAPGRRHAAPERKLEEW
jgi:DNA replication protein DnaC